MANLAVQKITVTGLQPAYAAAAAGGDEFVNTGAEMLHVKCGATGATVTINGPNADNFGLVGDSHDAVVVIPANEDRLIGPFRRDRFNDANGKAQIAYSQVATVTVAVLTK